MVKFGLQTNITPIACEVHQINIREKSPFPLFRAHFSLFNISLSGWWQACTPIFYLRIFEIDSVHVGKVCSSIEK